MRSKKFITGMLVLTMLLALAVGLSLAQEPEPEGEVEAGGEVSIAAYISPVMSYQGRLVENGNPVNGTKSMTFRLYTAETGGMKKWEEGPKDVSVVNGLFHVTLGDTTPLNVNELDQELWLEIEVDGTKLPRQRLMGAPYAFSLVPGADITGNIGSGWSILYVRNEGSGYGVYGHSSSGFGVYGRSSTGHGVYGHSSSGHGVYARSHGSAHDGSALKVVNTNSSGIAIWANNDSTDTTLVVENEGSGPLIKGFGGDGGEDEFRLNNDGSIETKADSYIFISGNEFVKNVSDEDTQWDCQENGSVRIWSPTGAAIRVIYIPITLPGVLYGRAVEVESITIYYKCEDGTKSYIDGTFLYKQIDIDSRTTLVEDDTDRTSNTATSYTLDVNHTLSSDQGILGLYFRLHLAPGNVYNNYVQIGGVRIRLGHHHLY